MPFLMILAFSLLFVLPAGADELTARTDEAALSDLRPATGQLDIAEAWLIEETQRYAH